MAYQWQSYMEFTRLKGKEKSKKIYKTWYVELNIPLNVRVFLILQNSYMRLHIKTASTDMKLWKKIEPRYIVILLLVKSIHKGDSNVTWPYR